jgi:RNA polymerase sigma factor (sigma-70 family)
MMIQNKKEDFLKLIAAHKPIIYKICNSYCKNQYDRDDLAQEIIYQLWKSYSHFNHTVKFTTWMYRVALNVAITFYRKTKITEAIIQLAEPDLEIEDKKNDTVELEKNINTLQQFINQLKELDKALMILYLEEKSYSEIAEVLGITETNVATKIGRIKDKLKQKFSINN